VCSSDLRLSGAGYNPARNGGLGVTLAALGIWVRDNVPLLLPLLLSLWMAWGDIRTRRIPNYLTLGAAVAGLGFQLGCHGWGGVWSGILGLILGFGLLIIPYLLHGMGAGDVKALAALGTWLGPRDTLFLFIYMGIAGGVLIIMVLLWRGVLWSTGQHHPAARRFRHWPGQGPASGVSGRRSSRSPAHRRQEMTRPVHPGWPRPPLLSAFCLVLQTGVNGSQFSHVRE